MPSVDVICARHANIPIPSADVRSPLGAMEPSGCDAEALYYGLGVPVDFARARRCAYAEEERNERIVFGGAAILMMVYGNGQGTAPDFDLALRFACRVRGAPAELESRVSRLWRGRSRGMLEAPLDLCDDVTSGYMSGFCAAHVERVAEVARRSRRRAAIDGLPPEPLAALERASAEYFSVRSTREIDQTGTLRGALSIEERARLDDALVSALERLRDPSSLPDRSELPRLERQLAASLQRLATCKAFAERGAPLWSSIRIDGIRDTQRAWLGFREAFLALVVSGRPEHWRDAWHAELDRERLRQLEELLTACE